MANLQRVSAMEVIPMNLHGNLKEAIVVNAVYILIMFEQPEAVGYANIIHVDVIFYQ